MCGLYGTYSHSHLTKKERDAFSDLGFLSSLRGVDSAGIVAVQRKKPRSPKSTALMLKQACNPVVFMLRKEVNELVGHTHNIILMGHSRWATTGKVNDTNAHPMRVGSVLGMHNGVVDKYKPMPFQDDKATDSRLLYEAMEKEGVYKTLANLWSKDAYALTWYDEQASTLNFIRNEHRPLVFASTDRALFWASEARMLDLALNRNGIKIEDITELPIGKHMVYNTLTQAEELIDVEWDKYKEPARPFVHLFPGASSSKTTTTRTTSGGGATSCDSSRYDDDIPWNDIVESVTNIENRFGYLERFLNYEKPILGGVILFPDVASALLPEDQVAEHLDKNVFAPGTKVDVDTGDIVDEYEGLDPNARYRMRVSGIETWVDLSYAKGQLSHGCFNCKGKSSVEDVSYWVSPSVHICEECIDLPVVKAAIKQQGSVVKSELINMGGKLNYG